MPKEIAAKGEQRRRLFLIAAIALLLVMAAGCARTVAVPEVAPDGEVAPTPATGPGQGPTVMTGGGPAFGLGRTRDIRRTTGTGVETDRDKRLRDSRLQRRERTIEGRVKTIGRQIDNVDIRRRHRLDLEHHQRFRPEPREVLLEQERRRLQFERRSVQRERDRLGFERRVERSPRDPFTNRGRFPQRSVIQR